MTPVAVPAELGEGPREEQVAHRQRTVPAGARHNGGTATTKRCRVEHVVVDQGRHVNELDSRGGPDCRLTRPRPGAEQHQHRAQALSAGSQRRAGVRGETLAVALRQ